jgi:hypothetical protein
LVEVTIVNAFVQTSARNRGEETVFGVVTRSEAIRIFRVDQTILIVINAIAASVNVRLTRDFLTRGRISGIVTQTGLEKRTDLDASVAALTH